MVAFQNLFFSPKLKVVSFTYLKTKNSSKWWNPEKLDSVITAYHALQPRAVLKHWHTAGRQRLHVCPAASHLARAWTLAVCLSSSSASFFFSWSVSCLRPAECSISPSSRERRDLSNTHTHTASREIKRVTFRWCISRRPKALQHEMLTWWWCQDHKQQTG